MTELKRTECLVCKSPITGSRIRSQDLPGVTSARWLSKVKGHAQDTALAEPFGIFGTATAGGWLSGVLGSRVTFFVDEDAQRVGKHLLGRSMLSPAATPDNAVIYIGSPSQLASAIGARLAASFPDRKFIAPLPWGER